MSALALSKVKVEVDAEKLWQLFELACCGDLYDSARNGGYHPALRHACELLDEAGLGEQKTSKWVMCSTTPREFLKYLDDVAAEIAAERAAEDAKP